MTAVLQVATPEGASGKILTSAGDYLFRYHEDAKAQAAISLLKNKSVPFSIAQALGWLRRIGEC